MRPTFRLLQCANVFLSADKTAKLGDLNVSKVMKQDMYKTQTGTPYYASPEVWKDQPYDWRSDIWSLGCVLYEMITLKPPFRAQNMEGLYKKVVRGIYPKINMEIYSEDIAAVVKSLLQVNPELRPSCQDILSNTEVKQYADLLCPDEGYLPVSGQKQADLLKTIRLPKKMLFLGGRLPKAQYDDPDKILEQEEIDEDSMHDFMNRQQSNRSNSNIPKFTKHSMLSAKISPSNSLVGLRATNDPSNKSVIEENHYKDNDSLH